MQANTITSAQPRSFLSQAELSESAKQQAREKIAASRENAATTFEKLAQSTQAAAKEFEKNDLGSMSQYILQLGEKINQASGYLREKPGDKMVGDLTQMAKENPGLFLAGCFAAGLGVSRFTRASQAHPKSESKETSMSSAQTTAGYAEKVPAASKGATTAPFPEGQGALPSSSGASYARTTNQDATGHTSDAVGTSGVGEPLNPYAGASSTHSLSSERSSS